MSNNYLAIDFGSSTTKIYKLGTGVVLSEASAVAISGRDKNIIKEIGNNAKELKGRTADSTYVISPIFEGEVEDEKMASVLLSNFLKRVYNNKVIKPNVVLAVPCGSENVGIKRFEKVFNNCGIYNVQFIESPILTAIGLGVPITSAKPCFIIDIGGGTTEIAAVSLDGVIAGVTVNMGGTTIDAMIIRHIENEFNLKIGALTSENIKIKIASLINNDRTQLVVNGRNLSSGKPTSVTITAQDIIQPIKTFFDKIFEITALVMAKLPAEVSAEIRADGVYFAGGVSKIPGLRDYFGKQMGVRANVFEEPERATINGCGFVAGDKNILNRLSIKRK